MNYPNQYIPQKYNTYVVQMPSQAGQTSNQGNISVLPANNGTHYQISSGYSYYTDVNNQGAMQGHYPQQVYPQSGTMNSTVPKFKQEAIPSENQVVSHNYALQAPRSSPVTGPSSGPQTNNVPIQSSQAAPIPSQKPMPINQLQSPAAPMSYPSGMAMNPAVDPQRPMQQNPGMRAQGAVNAGVPMQTRVVPQTGVSSGPMQSSGVPNVIPMNSMHPEAYSFIAPYIPRAEQTPNDKNKYIISDGEIKKMLARNAQMLHRCALKIDRKEPIDDRQYQALFQSLFLLHAFTKKHNVLPASEYKQLTDKLRKI